VQVLTDKVVELGHEAFEVFDEGPATIEALAQALDE